MKIELPVTRCAHFGNIFQCIFGRVDMQYKIREELFEWEWVVMTNPSGGWVKQGSIEKPYERDTQFVRGKRPIPDNGLESRWYISLVTSKTNKYAITKYTNSIQI